MPYVVALIGVLLVVTALRGTTGEFLELLRGDVSGFLWFILALIILGAIGAYIPAWQKVSGAMIFLIVVAFMISNRGGIAQLASQVREAQNG